MREPVTATLVAATLDPPDRFYRYPLAESVVPWVAATRVTPNQVTVLHTLLGVAAAGCVWRGTPLAILAAGVLWELHLVLDCLDGVLARVRRSMTVYGRFLDIIGDTVAYLALALAMYGHVRTHSPDAPAGLVTGAMIATGALTAWAHDFYRRKLTAALVDGTDPIYADLLAKHRVIAAGRAGFVAWFGYAFDWLQVVGLQPMTTLDLARRVRADAPPHPPGESAEVRAIVASAATPEARRACRAIGLMSNDNNVTIIGLGLLSGHVLAAEIAAAVYGAVALVVGVVICQVFLMKARQSC